jgi:hypothetical protein
MRVPCTIDETEIENENGYPVSATVATCSRCDHQTESFGTSGASVRRCLVLMREECPYSESNFYVGEGDDE